MEKPGQKVGVVATSGALTPQPFEAGLRLLKEMECEVHVDPSVYDAAGYLAGPPGARANTLLGYAESDLHLIIGARGGFGALELLSHLDDETLHLLPPIMGFSDMTALLVRLVGLGKEVVHGPTVQSLDDLSQESLDAVVGLIQGGVYEDPLGRGWEVLCAGEGRGTLTGGNLITLASMCGTPWQPDFGGAIVALEEVNEAPYRVERALVQLELAGALEGVAGIILGECLGCGASGKVEAIVAERFAGRNIPVVAGGLFGHGGDNLPLAFGREVTLSSGAGFSYGV